MRVGLACVVVSVLIGCGGSNHPAVIGDDGDDQPKIDAGIDADLGLQPPTLGFQFQSPTIDVKPGTDKTYCYYLDLPNTADAKIQKWESELTPNVEGVVLYVTPNETKTPGTLITDGCGYKSAKGQLWVYQTQTARDAMTFPANDGTGHPVGFPIIASQPAYLQIHIVNSGAEVIHEHVKINGNIYPDSVMVTEAGPYITYDTGISIPPGSAASPSTAVATRTCRVPAGSKFFSMSTHTFRHGSRTQVTDTPTAGATTTLFEGTNWLKPNDVSMIPATFYTFSGKLTIRCEYTNTESATIVSGDDASQNEMCVAVGYYFPSLGGVGTYCEDGILAN